MKSSPNTDYCVVMPRQRSVEISCSVGRGRGRGCFSVSAMEDRVEAPLWSDLLGPQS